jgi:hypothetical protein
MGELHRAEIDILLLVSEADSASGESDNSDDDESDSYNCGSLHGVSLSVVQAVNEYDTWGARSKLAFEVVNGLGIP